MSNGENQNSNKRQITYEYRKCNGNKRWQRGMGRKQNRFEQSVTLIK